MKKKVGEPLATLFRQQAGENLYFVIELGMVHDGENRAAGPGFGIEGGVDEAREASVKDGSRAHGTRFECYVEGAMVESIVFEGETSLAKGYDFGVGGGVAVAEDPVLASAYDLILIDDDCTYGDFAVGFGGLGFSNGGAQVGFVCHFALVEVLSGFGFERVDEGSHEMNAGDCQGFGGFEIKLSREGFELFF